MHFSVRWSLFTLVALGLAACSETNQPLPQEVDFQFTNGPACDYRPVKKDARAYFPKSLDRTVQDMIRSMQQAGTDSEATGIGFDIIALVAQVTRDGLQDGSFEDASDLTNGLLACMTFATGFEPADPIDFTGALDLGAYEVRGGLGDPVYPVVSHLCDDPSGICPEGTWGVEPADGDDSWGDVTGGQRYLVYGAIAPAPGGGETQLTETFDWNTVPLLPLTGFVEDVRVARCTPEDEDGAERVQRGSGVPIILPFSEPTFCANFTTAANFGSGLLGTLKQWTHTAGSLLMPRPLFASASPGRCCGGTAGGFTPFVVVTAGNVNLTFEDGPFDAVIDPNTGVATLQPVEVSAKGDQGTPLPEVIITLTVELNQGSWVELGGTSTLTTDPDCTSTAACIPTGTVTYDDLTLNKPGGYRLVATASLFGYDLAVVTSDAFHITQ
jgi:hypothetical protein